MQRDSELPTEIATEADLDLHRALSTPSATNDVHAPTIATQRCTVRRSHHFIDGGVRISQESVHESHPQLSVREVFQELPLLHATPEMW